MSNENPSAQADAGATTEAQGVDQNVGGNETAEERKFSGADVETIVKDRLAREQKKYAAEKAAYEKKLTDLQQKTQKSGDEDNFKTKLQEWEQERQATAAKLNKYREDSLRGQVERKLNELGCLDPELAYSDLKSRGVVKFGDDDEIVIDDYTAKTLDDLVKSYLAKKPHLVKAQTTGGVGTKGPSNPVAPNTNPYANYQAKPKTGRKLFSI